MSSLRRTAAVGARSRKRPKPMMISRSKGWVCGRRRQSFPKWDRNGTEKRRSQILILYKSLKSLAVPEGLEPPTPWFEAKKMRLLTTPLVHARLHITCY